MAQQATACKQLLLVLCLGCFVAVAPATGDAGFGRRLLIRPLPQGTTSCRNTMQGPWLMTDDKGKVCKAKQLDFSTGCCTAGEQHSCGMCNKLDSCCENFEHCVSCCMSPEHKPEERRKETPRAPNNKDSGVWADVFEYCLAVCRTHGRSTSHENAYIGARHHCFSKLGKPMLSAPLPAGSLDGVTVLLTAAGASCGTMCQQKGLACSQQHLHFLNSCDRLREVTNCEAGCIEEQHTPSMPAAVDPEAPKASRPALCLVGPANTPDASFSCDATANYMRRLCACTKPPAQAAPEAAAAAAAAGGSGGEGVAAAAAAAAGGAAQQEQQGAVEGPDYETQGGTQAAGSNEGGA
uniref:SREBP regulating gene protein n=1 Tax=Tetradesmus obliquus TaxID=3088 RepID=A0A383V7Q5_TETOB|eukprot:jgi/Sobl393_1/13660/SZX60376.1